MGMVRGVSDLCYIREDGSIVGIEVKLPGKRHQKDHIANQWRWGMNCSEWYILTEVEEIHAIVKDEIQNIKYTRSEVMILLNETKTKTIIF